MRIGVFMKAVKEWHLEGLRIAALFRVHPCGVWSPRPGEYRGVIIAPNALFIVSRRSGAAEPLL
jgi:hypothetical protein